MNKNPAFDSSIPVLTEVVLEPAPAESDPAESDPAEPVEAVAGPDWDALELRIVERILGQLQPQLDAVVRNALASAGDQIHIGLRQTVEQMVAQQIAAGQN
ncbi:MAG: hypothetical protein JWP72_2102 [Massilia sp.]|nr:hypothetical protein [Massilia sp.]